MANEELRGLVAVWLTERDRLDERIELARRLLDMLDEPAATTGPPPVAPMRERSKTMRKVAAERVVCPECGGEFSRLGLGVHRARHRRDDAKVTPIGYLSPFDPDAARDRAAGAI